MAKRIVVIGGGFAGVQCAKSLRKQRGKDKYEIVMFASENHMVFHPLLAEVASASINPKDMAAPLRMLLHDTSIRMEEVHEIRLDKNELLFESLNGGIQVMPYDQLVIACGTTSNLAIIPGMADHAFPMKTTGDALALQYHIINQMERAETCSNPETKRRLLTFVVVGGGFSGVEVAGEIYDFLERSARYYANFTRSDINVSLVHSRSQILPEVSSPLRDFARSAMERNGIGFILNAGAAYCTADGVGLKDGQFVPAGTVVCTIGTRTNPIVERLAVEKEHGRVSVNPDMSLIGFENAWAIGDCANVLNAYDNSVSPTTAQFAERQGAQAAANIVARLNGNPTSPFRHKSLGTLCSIGGRSAVGEVFGFKIKGTFAWMAWRGTYLIKLPSLAQQIAVALTWSLGFLFPPALTGPRIDRTRTIGHAYYRAGDWIFRQGQPAAEFYAIKDGEVEVVNETNGETNIVAILGKDDFFGEGALIDKRHRRNSCRAKTDVQLMILGSSVFDEVSDALAPLRKAVVSACQRRKPAWEDFLEVKAVLSEFAVADFLKPAKTQMIKDTDHLAYAFELMNEQKTDVLYVVDADENFVGLATRTDLLMAVESRVNQVFDLKEIRAKSFMVSSPVFVSAMDNMVAIAETMHEHGFKHLPVVEGNESKKLLGSIRAEDILFAVTTKLFDRQKC